MNQLLTKSRKVEGQAFFLHFFGFTDDEVYAGDGDDKVYGEAGDDKLHRGIEAETGPYAQHTKFVSPDTEFTKNRKC